MRSNTVARGYGYEHRKLREQWAPRVARGEVHCARCGLLIAPGTPWDMGHVDGSKTEHQGPEHAACNRATSGRRRRAPRRFTKARW